MSFLRKNIRLHPTCYKERSVFFVTMITQGRTKRFLGKETAEYAVEILRQTAESKSWEVLTYCSMPDHVHLLTASKKDGKTTLIQFISLFKQKTGHWFTQKFHQPLWQKSFWERKLRSDDDLFILSEYVLDNPVCAGLVKSQQDYPYSGTMLYSTERRRNP